MLQIHISPELRNPVKTMMPTTGFEKASDVEYHDPSNIVQHAGNYYVWYTEHHKDTDGFRDEGRFRKQCLGTIKE